MVRQTSMLVAALALVVFTGEVLAQTTAQDQTVVRVGGTIKAPRKTKNVPPVYPAIAQSARKEGVVIVELLLTPAGTVKEAKVLKSEPLLDKAALDAVLQWEYEPTLVDGVAVPLRYNVTVAFSLPAADSGVTSAPDAAAQPVAPSPADTGAAPGGGRPQPNNPAQPTDNPQPAPVRVGGVIRPPTKVVDVPPVYPDTASPRPQGVVILEILIAPEGYVQNARVLRSIPELDQAAVDAVMQWVYTPTLLNGVPVPVLYNITIAFSTKQ